MIDREEKYDLWFPIKRKLDRHDEDKLPSFKQRQIWWCHLGVNVGYEIFGKSGSFTRPVLIIKKYNRFMFLGAPITSTLTERRNHIRIDLEGRQRSVLLDQLRTLDSRRLCNLMERLKSQKFEEIKMVLKREF